MPLAPRRTNQLPNAAAITHERYRPEDFTDVPTNALRAVLTRWGRTARDVYVCGSIVFVEAVTTGWFWAVPPTARSASAAKLKDIQVPANSPNLRIAGPSLNFSFGENPFSPETIILHAAQPPF
jgi:hypothetical protein